MSWRSDLEDKHTLVCKVCGYEKLDPHRKPNQKYLINCPECKKIEKGENATSKLIKMLKACVE